MLNNRDERSDATLADLYDPLTMPIELLKAHEALDKVVDSLFAPRKKFTTEVERLALLFERYESFGLPSLK